MTKVKMQVTQKTTQSKAIISVSKINQQTGL
jgi:hypothetical protein